MVSGYPTSTSFARVDGWSTDTWVLGGHKVSTLQLDNDSETGNLETWLNPI